MVKETLNKQDAYTQYKTVLNKMNNTCINNLKKIEKQEATKRYLREKRAKHIGVSEKPKKLTEEFQAWKAGGSQNRWRHSLKKKSDLSKTTFGSPPVINKTVIVKP